MLDEQGSGRVSDGDSIEWLEVVDEAKRLSILFENAKPAGVVCGSRWFIDSGGDAILDNLYGILPL